MKIAIVGGGFFGTASAIKVKEKFKKAEIHLYEQLNDILLGASGKNQFRWHRGYHYPRSQETINECLKSYSSFKKYLGGCILKSDNYYAISKDNSLTDEEKFRNICSENNLSIKEANLKIFKEKKISNIFKVKEEIINISYARKILKSYLIKLNIKTFLKKKIVLNDEFKKKYDFVILSAYSENEKILGKSIDKKNKFQLVEKVIVKLPNIYNRLSIVVLDGNFMCLDPYMNTGQTILGSVKHSIHKESVGKLLSLTKQEINYLKLNEVNKPTFSNYDKIKKNFSEYFHYFDKAKYIKSFFVIRSTKFTKSDSRISEITKKGKIIKIFSGKWVSCFNVAKKITSYL